MPHPCSKAQLCGEGAEEITPKKGSFGVVFHHLRLLQEGLET